MKKLKLEHASLAVKRFVKALASERDGLDLELNGQVVCTILPALQFTEEVRAALIRKRWRLLGKVEERAKHIPAKVVERKIREAVETVRRRAK